MENLALKIKIAMLWLFTGMTYVAYFLLMLIAPGAIEELLAGEIPELQNPVIILTMALILLFLFIMPFLSLTLKDSINRWVNLIIGIIYALLEFGALIDIFSHTPIDRSIDAHLVIMTCSKIVATALIVRYAWKWPKE